MSLEEQYLTGEISSNDFFYLLLARTEMDIIRTNLSQTESDSDTVKYYMTTSCAANRLENSMKIRTRVKNKSISVIRRLFAKPNLTR